MDFKKLHFYTKNLHLLYVEDDTSIMQQSIELYELLFASVTLSIDGKEGLDAYKNEIYTKNRYFDIVITDINMPNIDGLEMIELIHKINSKQYISVVSARDENSTLLKLINLGIDSFLLKPMQEEQLLKALYKISKNIYNEKISKLHTAKIVASNEYLEVEIKKRTHQLKKQLYTDHLTGLKNRLALSRDIEKNEYEMLALIDIDRLQFINDLYGTNIGNITIRQFANILEVHTSQANYTLYRTSGDEFAICAKQEEIAKFKNFITRLSNFIIHLPLYMEALKEEIYIDATIGVSFEKKHLLTHADIALKFAKTDKKPYVIYKDSMNTLEKMQDTISWKRKIQYALDNDNIVPVFQPIVNCQGKIVKHEALMRLKEIENDTETLVSPYFFLNTAIATKQYSNLSKTMIKKALHHLIKNHCILSINLTYSDFTDDTIVPLIENILQNHDIGHRLIFEIVESEDIKDYKILQKFIKKFRKYGVKIAIDDFGSGFSNFGNIIQTSPDYIKIDGSLIKNIDKSKQIQTMVKAITQTANELGIKVIAEFVHSKEVFEKLQEFDIDEYQGYYFFEPSATLVNQKSTISN